MVVPVLVVEVLVSVVIVVVVLELEKLIIQEFFQEEEGKVNDQCNC